jgi:hypothetical protein
MMNCEQVQEALMDYIDRQLDETAGRAIEAHLETCAACRKEERELREVMQAMEETPMEQPGSGVRENFDRMLQAELQLATQEAAQADARLASQVLATENKKRQGESPRPTGKLLSLLWNPATRQMAAACFLLVAGIAIGREIGTNRDGVSPGQISVLQDEVKDMKQTLMFSLLKEESASERIRGVNYAEEMPHPNQQVIGALISTLNHDKNVNVRLASLYSLSKFSDNATVRDSLVSSLNRQTEPIIQIVMINILTENKEVKAIKPIQDILTNHNTLPEVKNIAREGLKKL